MHKLYLAKTYFPERYSCSLHAKTLSMHQLLWYFVSIVILTMYAFYLNLLHSMDWSQWWEAKFLLKFLATMSTAWVLTCISSLQCHAMGIPPRSFMLSYSLSCYILPQGVALWIPFTLKTFFLICCYRKCAVFLVVSVIHSLLSVGINLAGGYMDKMELYWRDLSDLTCLAIS